MVSSNAFNAEIADSQGTSVVPVSPENFDIEKYADYEAAILEKNRQFWKSDSGVLVYRRFRVPEVFSYRCKDMELSLSLQLAALEKSMEYKADIANFLEPWYGIGTVAAAFGAEYEWPKGQAPGVKAPFETIADALEYDVMPIEHTDIGKHTLRMIEYFLEKTKGRIPVSLTDIQSPMNVASEIIDINNFFMSFIDDPEGLKKLLSLISDLLIDFTKKQIEVIGDALAWPGHGFASSRAFSGLGMSDDTIVMLSNDYYKEFAAPNMSKIGEHFGGAVFHSCGNWSPKIEGVKAIDNLVMVDGAFSPETDPDPNPTDSIVSAFAGTGIVVNARIVGDTNVIKQKINALKKPGIKLIAVTYCNMPAEQCEAYKLIKEAAM